VVRVDRVVAAFESESGLKRICEMLDSSGISVKYRCRSGGEVIRAITNMGGGIVVCGCRFADMPVATMVGDLEEQALILIIANPADLDFFEGKNVYKLPTPVYRSQLSSTLEELIRMDEKKVRAALPRRSDEDQQLFERAKKILMEKNNIDEGQAHRLIQRRSMNAGVKVADTSRQIIEALER
jgi:response regulator NasT